MCEHFIFDNEMLLEEKKQSTLTINVAGQVWRQSLTAPTFKDRTTLRH
jgi:hypothetical protein